MNSKLFQLLESTAAQATAVASVACLPMIGSGDSNAIDGLAVFAMREYLNSQAISARVVIGEGERDEAPMLFNGELLGLGGLELDVAVDPVEGTNFCAKNLPNGVSVIALGVRGSLFKAPDVYMMKLATTINVPDGLLSLKKSPAENINDLAAFLSLKVNEIVVCLLDRERNKFLIDEVIAAGAKPFLISDGDIIGILQTSDNLTGNAHLYLGIGAAPEGVLAAVAIKAMGGFMQGKMFATNELQREKIMQFNLNESEILSIDRMVCGDAVFAMTGITGGFLSAPQQKEKQYHCTTLACNTSSLSCKKISTIVS